MIERKTAERVAREFHETYERLAPNGAAAPWDQIPLDNRELMIAVVWELLDRGVIVKGEARI